MDKKEVTLMNLQKKIDTLEKKNSDIALLLLILWSILLALILFLAVNL